MPFPIPASFDEDSRFSVLLVHPDKEEGIQTLFKAKRLFKEGGDKFAIGEIASANDIGPEIHGNMVVNLSLGTLHSLDAIVKFPEGTFGPTKFGRWEFRIQAQRVTASQYNQSGLAEFQRASTMATAKKPFDGDLVASLMTQGAAFDLAGSSTTCSFDSKAFVMKFGATTVSGGWEIVKRRAVLWLPKGTVPVESIGGDGGSIVGVACDLDLGAKSLKPSVIILKSGETLREADIEATAFVKSSAQVLLLNGVLPGVTIEYPEVIQDGFYRVSPSVKFDRSGQATIEFGEGRGGVPATWKVVAGQVLVETENSNLPSYVKPKYTFLLAFVRGAIESVTDIESKQKWKLK
jgi:hypothetical protein